MIHIEGLAKHPQTNAVIDAWFGNGLYYLSLFGAFNYNVFRHQNTRFRFKKEQTN